MIFKIACTIISQIGRECVWLPINRIVPVPLVGNECLNCTSYAHNNWYAACHTLCCLWRLGMVKLTRSLAKVGKQIFMKKQNECLHNYRITATWVRSHCPKWAGQSNLGDVCLYPESIRVGFKAQNEGWSLFSWQNRQVGCCQEWKALSTTVAHCELVGACRTKYEYNYDHAQGNNLSTIRD